MFLWKLGISGWWTCFGLQFWPWSCRKNSWLLTISLKFSAHCPDRTSQMDSDYLLGVLCSLLLFDILLLQAFLELLQRSIPTVWCCLIISHVGDRTLILQVTMKLYICWMNSWEDLVIFFKNFSLRFDRKISQRLMLQRKKQTNTVHNNPSINHSANLIAYIGSLDISDVATWWFELPKPSLSVT